jgi:hypothetical protein
MVKGGVTSETRTIVEEYNRSNRILKIALSLLSVISEVTAPSDLEQYFMDEVSPIFTHNLIKQAYALEQIEAGDIFVDASQVEIEIQENWILTSIDFSNGRNIIPASFISLPMDNPLVECLVWKKIILVYKPSLASYYPNKLGIPIDIYRYELPDSYPSTYNGMMPKPSASFPYTLGIFNAGYNGGDGGHERYMVSDLGLKFLACDSSNDSVALQEDIYPAFAKESEDTWTSTGINGSWAESYAYIKERMYDRPLYRRPILWCQNFGLSYGETHIISPMEDRVYIDGYDIPGQEVKTGGGTPPDCLPTLIPIIDFLGFGENPETDSPFTWIR